MIHVLVNIKSVGKRKPPLKEVPYSLPEHIRNLSELITAVVRSEVDKYNAHKADAQLFPYLTETQIEDQATAGKVGFGCIYFDQKADVEHSVSTALQGFEDGLFKVCINESEVAGLDTPVCLKEGDVLTFIRLTFLAGRLW